jgi:deazaflavin-dependent oxidoreductase (nitroreductase family)
LREERGNENSELNPANKRRNYMRKPAIKNRVNTVLTQMFWGIKQWLYRGKKPNWIAKLLNGAIANSASKSVLPDGVVALEVIGRKSGRIVSFPLVVANVDGQRYVASMLGDNSQWVHNVRAAGGKAVVRSGGYENVLLEEIPADKRAPLLKAYLYAAPGARPHVPVDMDAPIAEFERIAAGFPVFRLTSIQTK